jgi:hypothetical protein
MSKSKLVAGLAAMAFGAMLFVPGAADARDRVSGAQTTSKQDLAQYEFSSHRRRHRHRHYVRRYYGPSYGYAPYYGPRYGYSPYYGYGSYYRPYYGPRAGIGIGPFGIGVGFGW